MNLDPRQLIEATLFVSTDPISMKKLEEISGASGQEIRRMIKGLQESYSAQKIYLLLTPKIMTYF